MLPSTIGSSTPVTVTVCVAFQFALENVTLAGATVPSVRSHLVNPTVTFAVGALFSPLFFFNDPATTEIYTLSLHDALPISTSLSVLATDTSLAFRLL